MKLHLLQAAADAMEHLPLDPPPASGGVLLLRGVLLGLSFALVARTLRGWGNLRGARTADPRPALAQQLRDWADGPGAAHPPGSVDALWALLHASAEHAPAPQELLEQLESLRYGGGAPPSPDLPAQVRAWAEHLEAQAEEAR